MISYSSTRTRSKWSFAAVYQRHPSLSAVYCCSATVIQPSTLVLSATWTEVYRRWRNLDAKSVVLVGVVVDYCMCAACVCVRSKISASSFLIFVAVSIGVFQVVLATLRILYGAKISIRIFRYFYIGLQLSAFWYLKKYGILS